MSRWRKKRTDVALEAFQKTLESSPDDYTRAWADVYLGMIYRSQHDFTLATKYYQDALAVNGASDKAKQSASSELQKISIQSGETNTMRRIAIILIGHSRRYSGV